MRFQTALIYCMLLLIFTGCQVSPPPLQKKFSLGTIRATSQQEIAQLEKLLIDIQPRLLKLIPGSKARLVDVWVQQELKYYTHESREKTNDGFALPMEDPPRIHLRADSSSLEFVFAHELTHVLFHDDWEQLPAFLEEGICDILAEKVVPHEASLMRARRLIEASHYCNGLSFGIYLSTPNDFESEKIQAHSLQKIKVLLTPETNSTLNYQDAMALEKVNSDVPIVYGLGYLLAKRLFGTVGINGITMLCHQSEAQGYKKIPIPWIMRAARLQHPIPFKRVLSRSFGLRELNALYAFRSGLFEPLLSELIAYGKGRYSAEEMQELFELKVLLPNGQLVQFDEIQNLWIEFSHQLNSTQNSPH